MNRANVHQIETNLSAMVSLSTLCRTAVVRDSLLPIFLNQVEGLIEADAVALAFRNQHSGSVHIELASGEWAGCVGASIEPTNPMSHQALSKAQPVTWHRPMRTTLPGFLPDALAQQPFESVLCLPMIAQAHVLGLLWVGLTRTLTSHELHLLALSADMIACVIDRLLLARDAPETQLFRMADALLAGWMGALDARDSQTHTHCQHTALMTVQLAQAMGVAEDELPNIWRGALLHDIGKLAIPDSILQKPGLLTPEEWRIMRLHPVYAYKMLSPLPVLHGALDIPTYHHERWDGSGYPYGLKGVDIPLAARIFAVVDVWDALCSDRPYRQAWSEQRVRGYIAKESGSHFDPQVVDVFLGLLENGSQPNQKRA